MHPIPRGLATGALMVLACAAAARAQSSSGVELLLLPVGARSAAMGGGYAAAGSDPEARWLNPAAGARAQRPALTVSALDVQGLFRQTTGGAMLPALGGTLAMLMLVQRFEPIPATDDAGAQIGEISPQTAVLGLGYARPLVGRVAFGMTARAIRCDLARGANGGAAPANAAAVDLGVQVPLGSRRVPINAVAAVSDIGSSLRFDEARDPLPERLRFALAAGPTDLVREHQGLLQATVAASAVEYVRGADRKPEIAAGGELSVARALWLRGGVTLPSTGDTDHPVRLGLGLSAGRLRIDLARRMSSHPALGDEWTASLALAP